jgi:hypothetical protein
MLEYIFNTNNLFRILFYTPWILGGSIAGGIIYDYITYKEEGENKKND